MEYLFLGWKGVIFVTLFVAIDEFSLERADSVSHPDWDLFYVDSWKFYVDEWWRHVSINETIPLFGSLQLQNISFLNLHTERFDACQFTHTNHPTVLLPRDRSQTSWKTLIPGQPREIIVYSHCDRSAEFRGRNYPRAIMIMATVAESPNPC